MIKLSLQVPTQKNCNAIAKLGKTHIYEKKGIKRQGVGGGAYVCMFSFKQKAFSKTAQIFQEIKHYLEHKLTYLH